MIYTYLYDDKKFILKQNENQFDVYSTSTMTVENGDILYTEIGLRAELGSILLITQHSWQEDFFVPTTVITHHNRFVLEFQVIVIDDTVCWIYNGQPVATIVEIPSFNMGNSELNYSERQFWLDDLDKNW